MSSRFSRSGAHRKNDRDRGLLYAAINSVGRHRLLSSVAIGDRLTRLLNSNATTTLRG
jgi:hypothetical protein